jgi:hypothetical protein
MIVLLYTSHWEEPAERLQRLIQSSFPVEGIEIYRTLSSFLHRLQNPPDLPFVVVLLAGERNELLDFRSIDHLLGGTRRGNFANGSPFAPPLPDLCGQRFLRPGPGHQENGGTPTGVNRNTERRIIQNRGAPG